MATIRKPAVAGYFYPGSPQKLQETIDSLTKQKPSAKRSLAKGAILPHAGYDYSGLVAAQTVSCCELKNRIIILGPKHRWEGKPFSVMTEGSWQTPLGNVEIDSQLANKIVGKSKYLQADALAHHSEHCIEVLLPFLQFMGKEITIVPILVSQADKLVYKEIAEKVFKGIKELHADDEISIIASSDMTHYESHESAQKKDHYAIESILGLDADGLLERVERLNISMCGVVAVFILIEIVKKLGATHADLIKYQTSGDSTGDFNSVVGYAGIRVN